MYSNQAIDAVSTNAQVFMQMSAELDRDIANAAAACVKAGDPVLMQQLVDSVPEGHEFTPMLKQLAENLKAAEN